MSTVPEIIVANHLKLSSGWQYLFLTDECDPDNLKPVDIPEIIAMAGKAEPEMITTLYRIDTAIFSVTQGSGFRQSLSARSSNKASILNAKVSRIQLNKLHYRTVLSI